MKYWSRIKVSLIKQFVTLIVHYTILFWQLNDSEKMSGVSDYWGGILFYIVRTAEASFMIAVDIQEK